MDKTWNAIKALFSLKTGYGKSASALSPEAEAITAVFLPLAGLAVGLCANAAMQLAQWAGFYLPSFVAAMAVLLALGGWRQLRCALAPFGRDDGLSAAVPAAVLVILFQLFAVYELHYAVGGILPPRSLFFNAAVLYLPVVGALGTVTAASVKGQEQQDNALPGVKGGHMLCCALLSFVLMLPRFGFSSLIFLAATVFAAAATALVLSRMGKGNTTYAAAVVSELVFLFVMILLYKIPIYIS